MAFRLAMARIAKSGKADEHHRPGRWLRRGRRSGPRRHALDRVGCKARLVDREGRIGGGAALSGFCKVPADELLKSAWASPNTSTETLKLASIITSSSKVFVLPRRTGGA